MPNEWTQIDAGGRELHQTLSHELGHNLGFGDLYKPKVQMTPTKLSNVGGWDIMDNDGSLPHFSIASRMMLGWVEASSIKPFNFQKEPYANEPVVLHPIEQGNPPAGRFSGIEIRIADGKNYYFEYRNGIPTHIGDRQLPINNRVLGTSVEDPGKAPTERAYIMLLDDDEDNDGSVLAKGTDYKETDDGVPFSVSVTNIDGDKADLHVLYNGDHRPDPSIRNRPAGPDREWQSPDIEVINMRNSFGGASKDWFNVPWEGHPNTVVANVHNSGDLYAPKVRVNFAVSEFSFSPTNGAPTSLGFDERDIPAGSTVQFSAPKEWIPPRQGHYCVTVDIPFYKTPGFPPAEETNINNNLAMSNYTRQISRTDSPASREAIAIDVINPYSKPTRVFIRGGQTNPLYRTFIEYTSLVLESGEKKKVVAMFEYAGNPSTGLDPNWENFAKIPNNVGISAFIEDPRYKPSHTAELLGGVQIKIANGRSTKFNMFENNLTQVHGLIVTRHDNKPVPGEKAILIVSLPDGKSDYIPLSLSNGEFSEQVSSEWKSVRAYYVGIEGYADCYSKRLYNRP